MVFWIAQFPMKTFRLFFVPLKIMCVVSPAAFKIFLSSLVFHGLIMISFDVCMCVYVCVSYFEFIKLLKLWVYSFCQIWKIAAFLQIFSCISSAQGTPITHTLDHLVLYHRSLTVCSSTFPVIFLFLFHFGWILLLGRQVR